MAKNISILFVIGSMERGGAEGHVARLARELVKTDRYSAAIYCLSGRGELADELESDGVAVVGSRIQGAMRSNIVLRAGRLCLSVMRLWTYLLVHRPQVVHTFLPEAAIIGAAVAWLARIPVRVCERRSLNHYRERRRFVARIESWILAHVPHAIVGNSRAVVSQLIGEQVPTERVALIYNGIDPNTRSDASAPAPPDTSENGESLVITVVANLIPYKGHADVLEALHLIDPRTRRAWLLECLGADTGILAALDRQARELGVDQHVRWRGSVDDVDGWLRRSDIGLSASHEEGFSNAILEYMRAGLPVIATDVGGNREAVVDGETGLLVPARSPERLAAALVELATDAARRTTMGTNGRRRFEQNYSLSRCVERYEFLYDALIRNGTITGICDADRIPGAGH